MVEPLTLGTAGHIDHGKTALVAALTGTDTDRLPEERRRGISISLGYARLVLPSGRAVSVVDVPGHERFVRTMVAGATGIDCFLAVVAADDGVMPQTREHAAVLRALGVTAGVVAVTKSDLADPARAAAESADLFGTAPRAAARAPAAPGQRTEPGVEVVAVSARTGAGLDDLRAALDRLAGGVPTRGPAAGVARLHVDRVFTIRGAGTVVTGTLWSGTLGRGDEVLVLPGDARRARVRGVQVHDAPVDRADAGQRVAVNLTGVDRDAVAAGDVLVGTGSAGVPVATYRVDARLDCDPPARIMVHHGTRESEARAVGLGDDLWQLRLREPIVALAGDRLVIRTIAPPDTLGGGTIADPAPARRSSSSIPAPSIPDPIVAGSPGAQAVDEGAVEAVLATLRAAGLDPPHDDDLDPTGATLAVLRERGEVIRIGAATHLATEVYVAARDAVVARIDAEGAVTLAGARDALGSSRRVVQALLERLDADRVTLRRGDERVLRRRPTSRETRLDPP